jgi:hypothetical protein
MIKIEKCMMIKLKENLRSVECSVGPCCVSESCDIYIRNKISPKLVKAHTHRTKLTRNQKQKQTESQPSFHCITHTNIMTPHPPSFLFSFPTSLHSINY